jgi:ubiquinone/menaquinone biosynthesis C-methylase UbiE
MAHPSAGWSDHLSIVAEIYETPLLYDLEHAGAEQDVSFFLALASHWRPRRILEIACGNGRVTLPLAKLASTWGATITGLEKVPEMLESARQKDVDRRVEWVTGDVREWQASTSFDLVVSPCASLSHLLTLEDQLAAWRNAAANTAPGGHFVVAELMPDLSLLGESLQIPPRIRVELDTDNEAAGDQRLIRYKTTRYFAHEQRAQVHFLYDHFTAPSTSRRYVSDYEAHVYFPNELRLLFLAAGFELVETWGDYRGGALTHGSRCIVMAGRKPDTSAAK